MHLMYRYDPLWIRHRQTQAEIFGQVFKWDTCMKGLGLGTHQRGTRGVTTIELSYSFEINV
jgi:hypothetical protein